MENKDPKIRNFSIIAHIDHGKSTLADRFLEITKTVDRRQYKHNQILDTMDLEQERGITIKLQPVRMNWKGYELNLIDTPGHVDFTYEVSRSLAACEGAILVVDATQGIEAQTIANVYLALDQDLEIIPVINKIDLPAADIEKVTKEIEQFLGISSDNIIAVSAKTGKNAETVLDAIIENIPPPSSASSNENRALIFDSTFNKYKGVVAYVKVLDGSYSVGDTVYFLNTKKETQIIEVGYFNPGFASSKTLSSGQVGYIITGVKSLSDIRVGDTIANSMKAKPWPGYKTISPMVFASLYCVENDDYLNLKDALDKLSINDSSLTFEPESSQALGTGFRCGFLGLLHMEIVQERLEREFDLDLIITAPSVSYIVHTKAGEELFISNPANFPDRSLIEFIEEPMIRGEMIAPKEYVGNCLKLLQIKRGMHSNISYIEGERAMIEFDMPLSSMITDFYDQLKSVSQGYASLNYTHNGYKSSDLEKLDILVAGDVVSALSQIVFKQDAYIIGSRTLKKLKKIIPKAQFQIALQAAIGMKIVARENISAMRKDVTAKLYGGDVTRKNKLLKKQKAGKKRMKQVGKISIPQEAFLTVLKND